MAQQPGITYEAVVLWRKKRKNYSVYSFITPQLGIITCSVPHKQLQHLKSGGYLQAFSHVYITVVPDGEYYKLQQVDGNFLVKSLEGDLDSIAYALFISDMMKSFFQKGQRDCDLYKLVLGFARQIQNKPVAFASIIMGWQLLSHAGFVPSAGMYHFNKGVDTFLMEVYSTTGMSLSREAQAAMPILLNYSWSSNEVINLGKRTWLELEKVLFAYTMVQADKELDAIVFINEVGARLFPRE